jgi:hypothetical protein
MGWRLLKRNIVLDNRIQTLFQLGRGFKKLGFQLTKKGHQRLHYSPRASSSPQTVPRM